MRTLLALMLAVGVCVPVAFARKWSDSTGGFMVEAEFVALQDGKVQLKEEDGTILSLPLETLSAADQDFVRNAAGLPPKTKSDTPSRESRRKKPGATGKARGKQGTKAPADGLDRQPAGQHAGEKDREGPPGLGPVRLGLSYPRVWETLPLVVTQIHPDGTVSFTRPPGRVFYGGVERPFGAYELRLRDGSTAELTFSPPDPGVLTYISFRFPAKVSAATLIAQYNSLYGPPKRDETQDMVNLTWGFKDRVLMIVGRKLSNGFVVNLQSVHHAPVQRPPQ